MTHNAFSWLKKTGILFAAAQLFGCLGILRLWAQAKRLGDFAVEAAMDRRRRQHQLAGETADERLDRCSRWRRRLGRWLLELQKWGDWSWCLCQTVQEVLEYQWDPPDLEARINKDFKLVRKFWRVRSFHCFRNLEESSLLVILAIGWPWWHHWWRTFPTQSENGGARFWMRPRRSTTDGWPYAFGKDSTPSSWDFEVGGLLAPRAEDCASSPEVHAGVDQGRSGVQPSDECGWSDAALVDAVPTWAWWQFGAHQHPALADRGEDPYDSQWLAERLAKMKKDAEPCHWAQSDVARPSDPDGHSGEVHWCFGEAWRDATFLQDCFSATGVGSWCEAHDHGSGVLRWVLAVRGIGLKTTTGVAATLKALDGGTSLATVASGATTSASTTSKGACRYWSTTEGCKRGSSCTFLHDTLDMKGKCFNCGSQTWVSSQTCWEYPDYFDFFFYCNSWWEEGLKGEGGNEAFQWKGVKGLNWWCQGCQEP